MKARHIPFLIVICCFFFAAAACVGEEETQEVTKSTRVLLFALDSINGQSPIFTIDNVNRRIFNRDSLPVGSDSILTHVKVDTFTTRGYLASGMDDTLFNYKNPQNFLPAMNRQGGIRFKVFPLDMSSYVIYDLIINVHLTEGDSLHWDLIRDLPKELSGANPAGKMKVIAMGDGLFLYDFSKSGAPAIWMTSLSDPANYSFQKFTSEGLENADCQSLTAAEGKVFVRSKDGSSLLSSLDGKSFSIASNECPGTIEAIVSSNRQGVDVIVGKSGMRSFYTFADDAWYEGAQVEDDFPKAPYSYATFQASNDLMKTLVMGQDGSNATVWMTMEDAKYISLDDVKKSLPQMSHPTILYHGDRFFAFSEKLDSIYISKSGLYWESQKRRYMLPEEILGADSYTAISDKDSYIWLVTNKNGQGIQIRRGRENKLGFKIR